MKVLSPKSRFVVVETVPIAVGVGGGLVLLSLLAGWDPWRPGLVLLAAIAIVVRLVTAARAYDSGAPPQNPATNGPGPTTEPEPSLPDGAVLPPGDERALESLETQRAACRSISPDAGPARTDRLTASAELVIEMDCYTPLS